MRVRCGCGAGAAAVAVGAENFLRRRDVCLVEKVQVFGSNVCLCVFALCVPQYAPVSVHVVVFCWWGEGGGGVGKMDGKSTSPPSFTTKFGPSKHTRRSTLNALPPCSPCPPRDLMRGPTAYIVHSEDVKVIASQVSEHPQWGLFGNNEWDLREVK